MQIPFEEGKDLFSPAGEEGEKGKLFGGKCKQCENYSFPPRHICKRCLSEEVERVELSGKGTIHASAVIINPPLKFQAPYSVAYVDLDEGPRLFTQLTSCRPEEIKIGRRVELVIGMLRHDENGNEIIGYKFKPVN